MKLYNHGIISTVLKKIMMHCYCNTTTTTYQKNINFCHCETTKKIVIIIAVIIISRFDNIF